MCGSVDDGGALSVISITDWVRAKVCDISQPSTHSVAVETHLRVTLSSSPPLSVALTLLSFHLSFADSQGVSVQLCFTCRVCPDGCCSVTGTLTTFPRAPLLSPSDPLLPFRPQVLSFWTPPHVHFASPPTSPPLSSSLLRGFI